jgi:hypothetical protein
MAKKAKLSWHEEASVLAQKICKSKKSGLIVLTQSGDAILKAGAAVKLDHTSIGALASAMDGARQQMDRLCGLKTKISLFGDVKSGCWVEPVQTWLVIGLRLPKSATLEKLYKHLKKKSEKSGSKASEALAGLSDAGLDAALNGQ